MKKPALILACVATFSLPTARAELVGHWAFDGDFTNAVGDIDGEPVNDVELGEDRFGTPNSALAPLGDDQQYVEVLEGGGLDDLQEGTIALWVKWSGDQDAACCGGTAGNVIARQSNGQFSNQIIGLDSTDPDSAFVTWQAYSAGAPVMVGNTEVGSDTWRHVAITFSDGEHILYLDGQEDATSDASGAINSDPGVPLTIGAWFGDGAGYSTSMIDDVRIYDTILTAEEIADLMSGTAAELSTSQFAIPAGAGEPVATIAKRNPEDDVTYTFELVAGDGDEDNDKFTIDGAALKSTAHDYATDGDGTTYEIRIRTSSTEGEAWEDVFTLTLNADVDGDDLPDAWELTFAADLTVLSGAADSDDDGLTDKQEFDFTEGAFPDLSPVKDDSDGDSLKDGAEVNPTAPRVATNPTDADSDDDGLNDGAESNTGTFVSATDTGSDPLKPDTDGDGTGDGKEVEVGRNPNLPDAPPAGLVGLWRFDDGDASDSSAFQNHGTLENDAGFTDEIPAILGGGRALLLEDDSDQHVLVEHDDSLNIEEGITIAAWVRPIGDGGWDGVLAKSPSDGSADNHAGNYELRIENGSRMPHLLYQRGEADDTTFPIATDAPIDEGVWTHLAVTAKREGTVDYYINGELAEEGPDVMEGFGAPNENPLYIGTRADLFTDFGGALDDVAIFNGLLSPQQIATIATGDFSEWIGGGGPGIQIVSIEATDDGNNVTWESREGATYKVEASVDLDTWAELSDGVPSGGETTTFADTFFGKGKAEVYYRAIAE